MFSADTNIAVNVKRCGIGEPPVFEQIRDRNPIIASFTEIARLTFWRNAPSVSPVEVPPAAGGAQHIEWSGVEIRPNLRKPAISQSVKLEPSHIVPRRQGHSFAC